MSDHIRIISADSHVTIPKSLVHEHLSSTLREKVEAAEAAYTALALHHGVLPPTINQETKDPACDLDCVPNEARRAEISCALTNSFGFGGTNITLALRRAPDEPWDGGARRASAQD